MFSRLLFCLLTCTTGIHAADRLRVLPEGEQPADSRLKELRTLNSDFPFHEMQTLQQWTQRKQDIKRRLLVSQGLWPLPTRSDLQAVVHGRLDFDDYTVERVYFQSIPGHFVTGSLYRPKGKQGPFPAVLCPHGHWQDARFYDAGEANARNSIASGAERYINAARNHIQARCVQLARMGCIAFFYDMTGNCDSIQLGHRPVDTDHLDNPDNWGFMSVQAELRLLNMMGLQTWNSVRSIDFLLDLPDVDPARIGVTGASGGGTQSMIIAAVDERISAAMPCVMVSTAMQGGCTCENAPLMRIDQGNVDIAAAIAPRPLGLTAADDWTKELQTKGYPSLKNLYELLGHPKRLTAVFHTHFPHNYNHVNRTVMYGFFNRHFGLGMSEPVLERDFELLGREQMTVWDEEHPAPSGRHVGDDHEREILNLAAEDAAEHITRLIPANADELKTYREIIGGAWRTIIGRRLTDVGNVALTRIRNDTIGDVSVRLGLLNHGTEQIPTAILRRTDRPTERFVVWVTDNGKSDVFADGKLDPQLQSLLDRGCAVVCADLSGQGEFTGNGTAAEKQRMWYQGNGSQTWHRFSGYTYGYNHSLFVQRTHDVLTLIAFARTQAQSVALLGLGRTAGPIAAAARSQCDDAVDFTGIDVDGFQFDALERHDDPMFVPGAVRYLGVPGLMSLCAPHGLAVTSGDSEVFAAVYNAAGGDGLRIVESTEELLRVFPGMAE